MNTQTNRWKTQGTTSTLDQISSTVGEAREQTDRMVRENPASAALVTFSIGCCLGFLTSLMLFPARKPEPHHWYDRVWHR
jgi:hypothetical protein